MTNLFLYVNPAATQSTQLLQFDTVRVATVEVTDTSKVEHSNCRNNINNPSVLSLMPFTRKQNAKAKNLKEMNSLSDYGNLDTMLGDGNTSSI